MPTPSATPARRSGRVTTTTTAGKRTAKKQADSDDDLLSSSDDDDDGDDDDDADGTKKGGKGKARSAATAKSSSRATSTAITKRGATKSSKAAAAHSDDDDKGKDKDNSDDDAEFTWKPALERQAEAQRRKRRGARSGKRSNGGGGGGDDEDDDDHGDDDDEDDDRLDPDGYQAFLDKNPKYKDVAALLALDETVEDDHDGDEFRITNRRCKDRDKNDPAYRAQLQRWLKFRAQFPIPLREFLPAGATFTLRKKLHSSMRLVCDGFPIHLRRDLWELLAGSRTLPERLESVDRYAYFLQQQPLPRVAKEIASDVPRALRSHMKYMTKTGQRELSNLLSAFACRTPAVGYCNSLSHIGGFLLLFYPEPRAFYMLISLIDILLPLDYYTSSLLGARADAQLIKILVYTRMRSLYDHLTKFNIDVYLVALRWLMPLFLTTLPQHVVIRVWDIMLMQGSTFLLSVAVALFQLHSKQLRAIKDEIQILEYVERIGQDDQSLDTELIIRTATSSSCMITKGDIERREIERRVMESEYVKELQVTQKFRQQDEERRRKEAEEKRKEEEDEEKALAYGTEMWKIGHSGSARKTQVTLINLSTDEPDRSKRKYAVAWDSKGKKENEARLLLNDCSIYMGMKHGQFEKRPEFQRQFANSASCAFSIIHPTRSLDLVCTTQYDFDEWMRVLQRLPVKHVDKQERKLRAGPVESDQETQRKYGTGPHAGTGSSSSNVGKEKGRAGGGGGGGSAGKARKGGKEKEDGEDDEEDDAGDSKAKRRTGAGKSSAAARGGKRGSDDEDEDGGDDDDDDDGDHGGSARRRGGAAGSSAVTKRGGRLAAPATNGKSARASRGTRVQDGSDDDDGDDDDDGGSNRKLTSRSAKASPASSARSRR